MKLPQIHNPIITKQRSKAHIVPGLKSKYVHIRKRKPRLQNRMHRLSISHSQKKLRIRRTRYFPFPIRKKPRLTYKHKSIHGIHPISKNNVRKKPKRYHLLKKSLQLQGVHKHYVNGRRDQKQLSVFGKLYKSISVSKPRFRKLVSVHYVSSIYRFHAHTVVYLSAPALAFGYKYTHTILK